MVKHGGYKVEYSGITAKSVICYLRNPAKDIPRILEQGTVLLMDDLPHKVTPFVKELQADWVLVIYDCIERAGEGQDRDCQGV